MLERDLFLLLGAIYKVVFDLVARTFLATSFFLGITSSEESSELYIRSWLSSLSIGSGSVTGTGVGSGRGDGNFFSTIWFVYASTKKRFRIITIDRGD